MINIVLWTLQESCKQDFVFPNSLMLDDIMELGKAKQIASAEKQVSWLIWGWRRLEKI